jgi:hypothetical protein
MDLPVKSPGETEVILDEVARVRTPAPEARLRSLRGLLRAGVRLRRLSSRADWARRYAEEQALAQRNIREFIARHEPRP